MREQSLKKRNYGSDKQQIRNKSEAYAAGVSAAFSAVSLAFFTVRSAFFTVSAALVAVSAAFSAVSTAFPTVNPFFPCLPLAASLVRPHACLNKLLFVGGEPDAEHARLIAGKNCFPPVNKRMPFGRREQLFQPGCHCLHNSR